MQEENSNSQSHVTRGKEMNPDIGNRKCPPNYHESFCPRRGIIQSVPNHALVDKWNSLLRESWWYRERSPQQGSGGGISKIEKGDTVKEMKKEKKKKKDDRKFASLRSLRWTSGTGRRRGKHHGNMGSVVG